MKKSFKTFGPDILTALLCANLDDIFLAPEPSGFTHHEWLTCHAEGVHCVGK